MTCVQSNGAPKTGFDLEYRENDTKHHYRAKRNFTTDEIVKALVLYSTGSDDLKKTAEWELTKW